MDIQAELAAEFPRDAVHWRVQGSPYERNGEWSAMALAYIDARDVMDRLDEVCGPAGWQSEFTETPSGRVLCRLGLNIQGEWIWKTDGAGGTQVEADKGGVSDALKRAAVQWGIGRYLYRMDGVWVACEVNKRQDKVYWKSWKVDPWSRVRAPQTPAKPVDRDEQAVQWFQTQIGKAKSIPQLEAWMADDARQKALARLGEEARIRVGVFQQSRTAELAEVADAI
jgi:hypothetical protein